MTLIKFKKDDNGKYVERMPYFSELFNDMFDSMANYDYRRTNTPAVNILENDDQFILELAAPGLKKEDFKIEVDNDLITISAEKEDKKETRDRYSRREFNYLSFSRNFNLPEIVDVEKIDAHYENGIMRIALPKKEEARPKPPRKIKIV